MNGWRDFTAGLRAPFWGWRFLRQHPELIRYAIPPLLLSLALYLAIFAGLFLYGGPAVDWLAAKILWTPAADAGWWAALSHAIWTALRWLMLLLLYLAAAFLGVTTFATCSRLVAGPFNDLLSERVESLLTGREPEPFRWPRFLEQTKISVAVFGKRLALSILLIAASLPLYFIPVLGSVCGFLLAAYLIMEESFDYAMTRHQWPIRRRLAAWSRNWPVCLGFGAASVLCLMIPVLGILAMPAGVAFATNLFVERLQSLPEPPAE